MNDVLYLFFGKPKSAPLPQSVQPLPLAPEPIEEPTEAPIDPVVIFLNTLPMEQWLRLRRKSRAGCLIGERIAA